MMLNCYTLFTLPRSTQPGHPFVTMRNNYQPKGGDTMQLAVKAGMSRVCCRQYPFKTRHTRALWKYDNNLYKLKDWKIRCFRTPWATVTWRWHSTGTCVTLFCRYLLTTRTSSKMPTTRRTCSTRHCTPPTSCPSAARSPRTRETLSRTSSSRLQGIHSFVYSFIWLDPQRSINKYRGVTDINTLKHAYMNLPTACLEFLFWCFPWLLLG